MVELKILAVVGLILTAVVTTGTAIAAVALARWTRRVIRRRLAPIEAARLSLVEARVRNREAASKLRC